MTARDRAAFHAGIRAAIDMALTAAVSLEIRPDAREVRQQAAAAALQGLADGLRAAFLDRPEDNTMISRQRRSDEPDETFPQGGKAL